MPFVQHHTTVAALLAVAMYACSVCSLWAAEPALPAGLGGGAAEEAAQGREPSLPEGLSGGAEEGAAGEPSLPAGLGGDEASQDREPAERRPSRLSLQRLRQAYNLHGFAEIRAGIRVESDPDQDDLSVADARLQLELARAAGPAFVRVAGDLLYDYEYSEDNIDLEAGDGWVDLREASVRFTPVDWMDIKVGRQILTWGTGDLIFINDLFPKDWNSFFIGRDDEYLKAPSDAVKVALFPRSLPNIDIIYSPRFDSDRFVDGTRLSFWNPLQQQRTGEDAVIDAQTPDDWLEDDELAVRLYRNIQGWEWAAYVYRGFWKSPAGLEPASQSFTFPELAVYGASLRGSVGPGIGYIEAGYYDSLEDRDGAAFTVANSELRLLIGYEKEVRRNLTATVQYYVKHMLDHDAYEETLPAPIPEAPETRHTLTLRLRQELLQQNLVLSLFTRACPTNDDVYLRPKVHYKITDYWSAEIGANLFYGDEPHTFLNQFARNSSVHAAVRYSF